MPECFAANACEEPQQWTVLAGEHSDEEFELVHQEPEAEDECQLNQNTVEAPAESSVSGEAETNEVHEAEGSVGDDSAEDVCSLHPADLDMVPVNSNQTEYFQMDEEDEHDEITPPQTSAFHRPRGMAPAEVEKLADKVGQHVSEGIAEAKRVINQIDRRLDRARPHIMDGALYCKQNVKEDMEHVSKDMQQAFGERQEAEASVASSFSHLRRQIQADFHNIRKDVDSAFDSVLRPPARHDEEGALNEPVQASKHAKGCRTFQSSVPATTCSLVSLAVASWLAPIRVARFAVANLAM